MQRSPSIWVCFFYLRRPSKDVHFQTPNTHIRAFCTGVAPPPPALGGQTAPIANHIRVLSGMCLKGTDANQTAFCEHVLGHLFYSANPACYFTNPDLHLLCISLWFEKRLKHFTAWDIMQNLRLFKADRMCIMCSIFKGYK